MVVARALSCAFIRVSVGAALGLLGSLSACARPEPPPSDNAVLPELVLPAFSTSTSAASVPAWMASLPIEPPTVAVGAKAWATLLQAGGELAEVAIVRVEAMGPQVLSVIDKVGQRIDGVPAALVHPVGDTRNLRAGTLALFYTWTTPGWIGRISDSVNGEDLRVTYDWAGTTKETAVDHAEPLRHGIAALAYVVFPKGRVSSMGQIVALDATRAWVLTGSGHVEIHARANLDSLDIKGREFTVGQAVRAHRWATGFEVGTIARVLEPGLRYEVAFGRSRLPTSYFIGELVAP